MHHNNNKDGSQVTADAIRTTQTTPGKEMVQNMVRPPKSQMLPVHNIVSNTKLVPEKDLEQVHPVIKKLFSPLKIRQNLPPAGRLKHFQRAWKLITKDPEILSLIKGYKIPLLKTPIQDKTPPIPHMSKAQKNLVEIEIETMLRKGAICRTNHAAGEFISNLFLVEKKDGGQRPVINLKHLNQFVPFEHFKMEGLHCLKYMLRKGDFMCKLDLKDAYFCLPLHQQSQKYVRFLWEGSLYQFLCLCFGLGPAPRVFTKLLKVPMAVLRRLNILIIIYIDDMLVIGRSFQETVMARDTIVFLLQHLGFLLNLEKSVLTPCQEIEFLGLKINSVTMTLSLPQEKVEKVLACCREMYCKTFTSILELTKLLGLLSSTIQAVMPAQLQLRHLQQLQIQNLKLKKSYQDHVRITPLAKKELKWWIKNLVFSNGRTLIQDQTNQIVIQTDASKKGWGAVCRGIRTGGGWSKEEAGLHINIQELLAVKFALQTFVKKDRMNSIHFQIDNKTALSYLLKMGGTASLTMINIAKEIWGILLIRNITITGEYLPSILNKIADWESRNTKDSSDWKLCPHMFQGICQHFGFPAIVLFASRLCHQLEAYISWKPDRQGIAVDAMQHILSILMGHTLYAFPHFSLIPRVLNKVVQDHTEMLIVVTPVWQTQVWYPRLLQLSTQNPIILPQTPALLMSPKRQQHPLVENQSLRLATWKLSGNTLLIQDSLITGSIRSSSNSNYDVSWRKWLSWCSFDLVESELSLL